MRVRVRLAQWDIWMPRGWQDFLLRPLKWSGAMFSFQRLVVYQKAREYNRLVVPLIAQVRRRNREQADQLSSAGGSLQHNIGEGASKDQPKTKAYHYRIAKGSAEECAAGWELCIDLGYVTAEQLTKAMKLLDEIARMLFGLIMRFDPTPRTPPPPAPPPTPSQDQDPRPDPPPQSSDP